MRDTFNRPAGSEISFDRLDGSEISFDNGILSAIVYSYSNIELGAQETRELYQAMKKYYDQQDLKDFDFFESCAKYVAKNGLEDFPFKRPF